MVLRFRAFRFLIFLGEIRHYAALNANGGFKYSLFYQTDFNNPILLLARNGSHQNFEISSGSFVSLAGEFVEKEKRTFLSGFNEDIPIFSVHNIVFSIC